MKIFAIQPFYTNNNQISSLNFGAHGKPLKLTYIVEKRAKNLPQRVLESANEILLKDKNSTTSLRDLHLSIYAPLLECKTLEEAKNIFPEFEPIIDGVKFKKESIYSKEYKSKSGDNFSLKMLQEYWAKLKTKENIVADMKLHGRCTLNGWLDAINFPSFPNNYVALLNASDVEGNRIIAAKTTAWNNLHPDLMYAHNRKAAQACKSPEYKNAQSKVIKDYDKKHPERAHKISNTVKEGWSKCPEVRAAMAEFAKKESAFIQNSLMKKFTKQKLNEVETRATKGFFKRFWAVHPEMKIIYAEARKGTKG